MATTQSRARRQEHRTSSSKSSGGNDFLSRMLQMEKQSMETRALSTSPILQSSERCDSSTATVGRPSPTISHLPQSQSVAPSSPARASPVPRSQTMPSLPDPKPDEKTASPSGALHIDTNAAKGDPAPSEICLSPSWSDHGEKKRKKETRRQEKDQKELARRSRKNEQGQRGAEARSGKRLSKKPPPAAMDTQKMPTGLRRNSFTSLFSSRPTSREGSRRNSLSNDEKRLSGISLSSLRSGWSHQTSATSTETIESPEQWRSTVSATAPRLPSFRWHSKKDHTSISKSVPWGSETDLDKDVVDWSHRLEQAARISELEKHEQIQARIPQQPRSSHFREHTEIHGVSRSATEPILSKEKLYAVPPRSPKRPPPQNRKTSEQDKGAETLAQPVGEKERNKNTPTTPIDSHVGREQPNGSPIHRQSLPVERHTRHMRPSHDGSSYVHKQRMYEQQMSIAGFEDQQAVQVANEIATARDSMDGKRRSSTDKASRSSTPNGRTGTSRTPKNTGRDSPETTASHTSHGRARRDSSPHSMISPSKPPPKGTPLTQTTNTDDVVDYRQENDGNDRITSVHKPAPHSIAQAAAGSKTDRILGFRRRTKPPPSNIRIPDEMELSGAQSKPKTAESSQPVEAVVKRSRIEKMITAPLAAHIPFRTRRDSASSSNIAGPPSTNEKSAFQGHSRSRTSSSQALTEGMQSSLSPPKAATSPKPTSSKKQEQTSAVVDKSGGSQGERTIIDTEKARRKDKPKTITSDTKTRIEPRKAATMVAEHPRELGSYTNAAATTSTTGPDTLVRKPSITRSHSQPQLPTETAATKSIPSLDFLPQLKHQPLTKSTRYSPPRAATDSALPQIPASLPSTTTAGADIPPLKPRSPLRPPSQFPMAPNTTSSSSSTIRNHSPSAAQPFSRSSTSITSTSTATFSLKDASSALALDAKPVAKLFVICCKCQFWHDLPSKLYEAMASPGDVRRPQDAGTVEAKGEKKAPGNARETGRLKEKERGKAGVQVVGDTAAVVRCPWCEHGMSSACCQGWTAVVYLHQRHH